MNYPARHRPYKHPRGTGHSTSENFAVPDGCQPTILIDKTFWLIDLEIRDTAPLPVRYTLCGYAGQYTWKSTPAELVFNGMHVDSMNFFNNLAVYGRSTYFYYSTAEEAQQARTAHWAGKVVHALQ